jgi:endonuclease/exonuclease/phosphatase family metal-dependent hydrolase
MQRELATNQPKSSHARKSAMLVHALVLVLLLISSGLVQKSAAQELRLMTWNLCGIHCYGGGSDGVPLFNRVILNAKVNPDVLAIQEVTLDQALRIAYAMGYRSRADILAHLHFVRCKDYKNKSIPSWYASSYGLRASDFGEDTSAMGGYPVDFGNAVITSRRFPIKGRARWTPLAQDPANILRGESNRMAVASIEISQNQFVNLCSMHTPNAATQAPYAKGQADFIAQVAKGSQGNYSYVLLGDFNMDGLSLSNSWPVSNTYNILRFGFSDAWYEWQKKTGAWDWIGTTTAQLNPARRYDYIFLDLRRKADLLEVKALNPVILKPSEYPANFISALYQGSDHYPVFGRVKFK